MCKCSKQHNCWGDHTFHCKLISKKVAHNIIQDSWALALQPALSTVGYICSLSILDIEKKTSTLLTSLHSLLIYLLIQTL